MKINTNNIKLVIWDLDDTFWEGTLSEGPVLAISKNINIVKALTKRGIINTICSKNDKIAAEAKLKEIGIDKYFVFNSINWGPKGMRIRTMLEDMGLRQENSLFIDDNETNIHETLFYCPQIMAGTPNEAILSLNEICSSRPITDPSCTRLQQYRFLEKRVLEKKAIGDNRKFLFESNVKAEIHKDCISHIDRIFELISRTNQLNFTKNRCSKEELQQLLTDISVESGYITAEDKYGDYGIVGFYAVRNNNLIHFLFSCRSIGLGIEQWTYAQIGWPDLVTVGQTSGKVYRDAAPDWINKVDTCTKSSNTSEPAKHCKILFKGPCDLEIMTSFLKAKGSIEEFTYISESRKNSIEHHNHSVNYLLIPKLSDAQRASLISECIFNDKDMFQTALYDQDLSLVFLSTLIEPNLGIYKRLSDGIRIAFGEYYYDLTDKRNWDYYISSKPFYNDFSEEFLKDFSQKYIYEGRITPKSYVSSIISLLTKISANAKICLILGSETPYLSNNNPAYIDREKYHKDLNSMLRSLAATNDRILLLDFNQFITGQESFIDNINHFQRNVYYQAAEKANLIIEMVCGFKFDEASFLSKLMSRLSKQISPMINPRTKTYRFLRKWYHRIKGAS